MKIQFHRIDTNVVVGLLVREFCCSGTDVSAKVLAMYADTRTSPMEPQWLAARLSQIKEILKKNSIWVLVYIGLGIFNSFMANYKVDYFKKVIDGLADRTLAFAGVATYGFILLVNY